MAGLGKAADLGDGAPAEVGGVGEDQAAAEVAEGLEGPAEVAVVVEAVAVVVGETVV